MKRIFSLLLLVLMLASAFAVLPVSAGNVSAGTEGNWEVHLDAFEEAKMEDGEEVFQPLPGYKYTDDGFEVDPPKYDNVQARYTVISKTKYSSKNFSIKIRLDDYSAEGDSWVSFSFWSEKHGLAQSSTNSDGSFGYGWYSLLRDALDPYEERDGKLSYMQTYNSGTKTQPGGNFIMETIEFEPDVDENGIQYLTFEVKNYIIFINGVEVGSTTNAAKALRDAFKNDEYLAYFGISVKSGVSNVPIKFTILEVDGVKPTGSDSKEPEVKTRNFGEMRDPSTVPAGVPGVLFDATFENQNNKMPATSRCTVDLTENNTFKITAHDMVGTIGFSVKDDYTVDVKDFPYVAILLKNYCSCEPTEGVPMSENCGFDEEAAIYYCAGDVLAPDDNYKYILTGDNMVDVSPDDAEDYYTIFWQKIDTTAFEEDEDGNRIHSLRFDFAYLATMQEFEIVAAGYFRDKEDIVYYLTSSGYNISMKELGVDDCNHWWKDASCTEPEYCYYCGKTRGEPSEHCWNDTSCTEPAYCYYCGIFSDEPVKGHDIIKHEAKDPTCTESGWDAYDTCSKCGYSTYQEKASLGHVWSQPTCTKPGKCYYCELTRGDKLGHDYDEDGECERCGKVKKEPQETVTTSPENKTESNEKHQTGDFDSCFSTVGLSVAGIVAVASVVGIVTFNKKKED